MKYMIYENLIKKEAKLALVGLGYVGLPIALEFAKRVKVVGFDINEARVDMMRRGEDPSRELEASDFENRDITFTADINASLLIIGVWPSKYSVACAMSSKFRTYPACSSSQSTTPHAHFPPWRCNSATGRCTRRG